VQLATFALGTFRNWQLFSEMESCTGEAFCKILAHGLGDRLLMTSIMSSSVSGGKGGGLHAGIGGLRGEVILVGEAIIHKDFQNR
jgi:hypothetical protein